VSAALRDVGPEFSTVMVQIAVSADRDRVIGLAVLDDPQVGARVIEEPCTPCSPGCVRASCSARGTRARPVGVDTFPKVLCDVLEAAVALVAVAHNRAVLATRGPTREAAETGQSRVLLSPRQLATSSDAVSTQIVDGSEILLPRSSCAYAGSRSL